MAKKAIILGITGLIGKVLAQQLFEDDAYDEVISIHRRKSGLRHPKLTEHVVDLFDLENEIGIFKADVVFCCVGTTKAKTKDKKEYKKIDYGIPLNAGKCCLANGINTFIVISALGADPGSKVFYNRTKGEMERDVLDLGIENTYFLEPALLTGDRDENRIGESIAIVLFKIIDPLLIGGLRKYRSIKPEKIAQTMRFIAKNGYKTVTIESDKIQGIADEYA